MTMKERFALASALALGVAGYAGSGSADTDGISEEALSGALEDAVAGAPSDATKESIDDFTSKLNADVLRDGGGVEEGEPNPGSVPSPILAEPEAVNVTDIGGHKVFTAYKRSGGYAYAALDFDCDGTGSFEMFPHAKLTRIMKLGRGSILWEAVPDGANHHRMRVVVDEYIEGRRSVSKDEFTILGVQRGAGGTMVVGETRVQSMNVERIVRYKDCPGPG